MTSKSFVRLSAGNFIVGGCWKAIINHGWGGREHFYILQKIMFSYHRYLNISAAGSTLSFLCFIQPTAIMHNYTITIPSKLAFNLWFAKILPRSYKDKAVTWCSYQGCQLLFLTRISAAGSTLSFLCFIQPIDIIHNYTITTPSKLTFNLWFSKIFQRSYQDKAVNWCSYQGCQLAIFTWISVAGSTLSFLCFIQPIDILHY